MADLNFPWEMYLKAQDMKNQNQQNMYQNIAGLGQGLGQGIGAIGQAMQQRKQMQQQQAQKKAWDQTINQMMNDPNTSPQLKQILPMVAQRPELMGQIGPQAMKAAVVPKPAMEWSPVSGSLSKGGRPLEINKATGEIREAGPAGVQTISYGGTMAPIRKSQYTLQDLPSNQGPSTAGGAAYQVKVGAKQGKALIAKPGSPQRTAAAAADLVRSITRVAPTDMALSTANFSQNLVSRWATLKQQLSANPSAVDNPKIRKEMYDIFDEMDKSATPFIANQLDDMADAGFPVTPATRKRQLGETLPNIPYQGSSDNTQTAGQGGWGIQRVQ